MRWSCAARQSWPVLSRNFCNSLFTGFIFVVFPRGFDVLPLCLAGWGNGFLREFFLCFLLYNSLNCFKIGWFFWSVVPIFWSVVPIFSNRSAFSFPSIWYVFPFIFASSLEGWRVCSIYDRMCDIQSEHKVFPWLLIFITRKLRGIQTCNYNITINTWHKILETNLSKGKKKYVLIPRSFFSNATTCPLRLRGPPHPRLWLKCNRILRLGRPVGAVTLSRLEWWWNERWIWGARGGGLKPNFYQLPRPWSPWASSPFKEKTHMVEPGIEPRTSWLVVRSSDHQATRLVIPRSFFL